MLRSALRSWHPYVKDTTKEAGQIKKRATEALLRRRQSDPTEWSLVEKVLSKVARHAPGPSANEGDCCV